MSTGTEVSNSKRYDRQIRIWGPHGQQKLESCKIALLNCSATGSETLKNLVLGGIASFTVVDGATIQPGDLGNNYLVDAKDLGQSRAKCVTQLLHELNEAVSGSYVEERPEVLIETSPNFFKNYNLVIATQMREPDIVKLDAICREAGVQLLIVRSYGLVGYLRASVAEHQVVESKPDSQLDDLRLYSPWPALKDHAMSFDLSKVDDITHHHIPFAVLLIQATHMWVQEHGKLPSGSKEQTQFKNMIRSMKRTVEGIPLDEENFDEAVKHAFHAWSPTCIPSEVRALLDDEKARELTSSSDEFWIMTAALKAFVEKEGKGCLPLEGSIPDMHATTELYLSLQRLYREAAEADAKGVDAHVRSILHGLGLPAEQIAPETVRYYCKHARDLRLVRYRTLQEEVSSGSCHAATLQRALGDDSTAANASFYVLLQAADRFFAQFGRYPGTLDDSVDEDVSQLKTVATGLLSEYGVSGTGFNDDYLIEMCRFGASELHVIAAFMGGIAAQEAIKLITHQFVPASGTLVYNGIHCATSCFEL